MLCIPNRSLSIVGITTDDSEKSEHSGMDDKNSSSVSFYVGFSTLEILFW